MTAQKARKPYTTPSVQDWGRVETLTATGTTFSGGDAKGGSVASMGQ